jgi:hypothetical protein
VLKPPGIERFKVQYVKLLSMFAFSFNLRLYKLASNNIDRIPEAGSTQTCYPHHQTHFTSNNCSTCLPTHLWEGAKLCMTFKDKPTLENVFFGHSKSRRLELTKSFERGLVFKCHMRVSGSRDPVIP